MIEKYCILVSFVFAKWFWCLEDDGTMIERERGLAGSLYTVLLWDLLVPRK